MSTDKPAEFRFIADVMVGRLARWLRILGFDVLYSNRYEDDEILRIGDAEDRLILTRDTRLVQRVDRRRVIFIEHDHYEDQVSQVLKALSLSQFRIFSRCPECNDSLVRIDKESVFERVVPYVYLTQNEFAECPGCHRVYWSGTHTEAITSKLKRWIPCGDDAR